MKCKAWDDDSGLHYMGTQNVTVETGSNEAILELNFITEDDHIKLNPTENGVEITIKGIDFDKINGISVSEYASGLRFTLDALMELWAYKSDNETEWIDTNVIDLPASGAFIPEENDDFQQNCAALFQGNKVDFLDFADEDATTVNARLAAYGKVLPVLLWRFTMTDVPYGWFELHPISAPFTYTPVSPVSGKVQAVDITNGQSQDILYTNGKPVLTVEKKDDIFSLTVNVPDHTTYMQIEEVNSGNSYHFTQKQGDEGVLICSGQEVTIPWAFRDPLYFCNNDEYQQNGFALYKDYYDPQTGAKTIEGIYNKTGLSGRPGMYTTGAIAFYLFDDDGVLLDSGRTDVWYGEYRLPLWSRNWDYNGEYPNPN